VLNLSLVLFLLRLIRQKPKLRVSYLPDATKSQMALV